MILSLFGIWLGTEYSVEAVSTFIKIRTELSFPDFIFLLQNIKYIHIRIASDSKGTRGPIKAGQTAMKKATEVKPYTTQSIFPPAGHLGTY